jgi:diaminopimelate decarboxylase/aspartate kinase
LANWRNIASVVRSRLAAGTRVLVVHSAVSGITDRLETCWYRRWPVPTNPPSRPSSSAMARWPAELGIGASAELEHYFSELRHIAAGIALMGEVSDRTRARVMSSGELMATELGARYLAPQGIEAQWWDARTG